MHSNQPSLQRVLGPIMAMAMVIGTTIGSGVFKKAFALSQETPYFAIILMLWIGGGIFTFLGALTYAEVVSLFPKAGGNFTILKEAYGPMWGFLWGWVDFVMIRSASLAALASIFADSFFDIFRIGIPLWGKLVFTISVLVVMAYVNVRGTKLSASLQVFITSVKVASLLMIACIPLYFLVFPVEPNPVSKTNLIPVWPGEEGITFSQLFSAFLAILWAYHGWGNIAPVSEEVRDPQRNIPLALLGGVGLVTLLYVSVNTAYHLVMPIDSIRNLPSGSTVATEALRISFGSAGALFASAAIMISVFGSLHGNLMAGPRLLYAMGQERMAPVALQNLHPVYNTPALAITVLAIWSSSLVLLGGLASSLGFGLSLFDLLTDFAMFGSVIFETMAILSIFVFRRIRADAERPYRCWGYPFTPILYAVIPACVLGNMFFASHMVNGQKVYTHHTELYAGLVFLFLGTMVYWLIIRPMSRKPAS